MDKDKSPVDEIRLVDHGPDEEGQPDLRTATDNERASGSESGADTPRPDQGRLVISRRARAPRPPIIGPPNKRKVKALVEALPRRSVRIRNQGVALD